MDRHTELLNLGFEFIEFTATYEHELGLLFSKLNIEKLSEEGFKSQLSEIKSRLHQYSKQITLF